MSNGDLYTSVVYGVTITDPVAEDLAKEAAAVAEIVRRVLDGTISPAARHLLKEALDRAEEPCR